MKSKGFNAHSKYMILRHASKGKNISHTCELFGISRTSFYNWQRAYQKQGMMGLEIKEAKKPQMPNKVSNAIEQEILGYVCRYPLDGPKRIYYELRAEGIDIGESGIYNVLRRHNLTKKAQRLQYSKNKGNHMKVNLKNNREIQELFNNEEKYPGYLVLQQVDYIGSFQGIGKIYQYTFYDTASRWVAVKIYNKKQDIDIWNYFEGKLIYLIKIFNLNIDNLITDRKKEFLPYFLKGNRYKEIIEELKINHLFISPEDNMASEAIRSFNEFIVRDFYNKISLTSEINSFSRLEAALNKFIREYNFNSKIPFGKNLAKTPVEVILERASQNNVDLDALPLWILALINHAKGGDHDE